VSSPAHAQILFLFLGGAERYLRSYTQTTPLGFHI